MTAGDFVFVQFATLIATFLAFGRLKWGGLAFLRIWAAASVSKPEGDKNTQPCRGQLQGRGQFFTLHGTRLNETLRQIQERPKTAAL